MSLRTQSISGAFWTFVDILVNKGVYFISTIIIAKILGPQDFGLIGMITVFVSLGSQLIDSGMSTSLMRMQQPTEQDYSTVFLTNLTMSIFIYLLIYFCAPFVAEFYNQEILIAIIRWYCLGFVIIAFKSVQSVRLAKSFEYRKMTILNIPGNIISVIVAIGMGYNGCKVWSLVALFLINQIVSTAIYLIFIKWKPLWNFDINNYKFHFKFGYKLMISSQINIIFNNLTNILIGKYYSATSLGYYERAYTFNNYPVSMLSGIIAKVSLVSFAEIKDDLPRLQKAYKNVMQIAFFISAFGLGFAIVIAKPLFQIILGEQWMEAVPLFQILSISYIFYPIHTLNIDILSLFGRSDLFLKIEFIKKIIVLIAIIIGFNFGIVGLVWSSVFSSVIALFINTYFSGKFINYNTYSQLKDLFPILLLLLFYISILLAFNLCFLIQNQYYLIASNFLLSLVLIVVFCEISNLSPYIFIKNIIFKKIKI